MCSINIMGCEYPCGYTVMCTYIDIKKEIEIEIGDRNREVTEIER